MATAPLPAGPAPGRPDIAADTERLWEVVRTGGVAIVPNDIGYAMWGATVEATQRLITAKQRGDHKRQGMVGGDVISPEIHILDQLQKDIVDCITKDYGLPVAIIAEYRQDHPLMRGLDPYLKARCTANGTIAQLLNAGGPFVLEIGRRSLDNLLPIFGSSANLTGTGAKHLAEDIEPEVAAAADLVLNYGLRRYHYYQRASTQIDLVNMKVTRIGVCYELISQLLKRHFEWDLPPDPGLNANRSGHLQEFALASANG